ncbi:MAG: HTH-type transcriptional repressor YtrA [Planctomycetota bacterium]|jgi:GntR family transcriptional regulator
MDISAAAFVVHPSSGVPIYRQLMDQVRGMIASGRIRAGDVLPSVRELGAALEVNFMTISKAWGRLESEGVVEHVRGQGMVVTAPRVSSAHREHRAAVRVLVDQAVVRGVQCGMGREELLGIFKSAIEENLK